ncbi:hypothetical protein KKA08_01330, partial [bacterium]|nr:hypothetical protein [bacterium]
MSDSNNKKHNGFSEIQETLLRSFWRVFTLPFRVVAFVYRRLAAIPIKNLILMTAIFIALLAVTGLV